MTYDVATPELYARLTSLETAAHVLKRRTIRRGTVRVYLSTSKESPYRDVLIEDLGARWEVVVPEGLYYRGEWKEQRDPMSWWEIMGAGADHNLSTAAAALAAYASPTAHDHMLHTIREIMTADVVIVAHPCGRTAYAELGIAVGARRKALLYMRETEPYSDRPAVYRLELADLFAGFRTSDFREIVKVCEAIERELLAAQDPAAPTVKTEAAETDTAPSEASSTETGAEAPTESAPAQESE